MARKTQRSQHKKQQRDLKKRSQHKRKTARRLSQEKVRETPAQTLRRARQMPVEGAWVQQGWQEQGVARIVLARVKPSDDLLFGEYVVDYLCSGIKDTSFSSHVPRQSFYDEVIPRQYLGTPPVAISNELAHEIVWGAVEYAESFGLRPPSGFRQSQRILEQPESLPRTGVIQFGYQGRPVYIPAPSDNQRAVISRLIASVGLGNFYYMPQGEVPEEVIDLLQTDQDDASAEGDLWTPGSEQPSGNANSESGLWVPGQESESQRPQESALWTPDR